jgi:hypothetical protein
LPQAFGKETKLLKLYLRLKDWASTNSSSQQEVMMLPTLPRMSKRLQN